MAVTAAEMRRAIAAELRRTTGRNLVEWIALLRRAGTEGKREQVAYLKKAHRLSHAAACVVVEGSSGLSRGERSPEQVLEALFAGKKSGLRPTYERLAAAVAKLGPDARVVPRKSYVSLLRGTQFGLLKVSTAGRMDLGLRLREAPKSARLRPAGTFGSGQVSQRVALQQPGDVDAELLGWLKTAYQQRQGADRRRARQAIV